MGNHRGAAPVTHALASDDLVPQPDGWTEAWELTCACGFTAVSVLRSAAARSFDSHMGVEGFRIHHITADDLSV